MQGIEAVIADADLSDHIPLRGRDCNITFAALDAELQPSQPFRTIFLQGLIEHGVLAPSFVVSAALDDAAIEQTVAAVAATLPRYRRALEHGPDTVLDGRPVQPTLRRRG